MEDKTYEATGHMSRLHTSNKPSYTLFIFIVLFILSLSLPFRFYFPGLKFTNVVDANDRLYMFLFCNVILVYLFFYSGLKRTSLTQSQHNQAGLEASQIEYNEISVSNVDNNQIHDDLEAEQVLHVDYEHEVVVPEVIKQIDDHLSICDQYEESETEADIHTDDEHELVEAVEVEEEEHDDQEEANALHQKCEAFIKKVKLNLHLEGRSYPMMDFRQSTD